MQTQPAGTFPVAGTMACLPGRMLLDTTDRDEVTAVIGELLCEHQLLVEGPAAQFHAQVRDCAVGDLRLAHFNYGTAFTIKSQPLGRYVVNFTINGVSRVRHGRESAVAGSGQATVLSPRAESELTWAPETDVLSLVVPKSALEEHFRRLSGVLGLQATVLYSPLTMGDVQQATRAVLAGQGDGRRGTPTAVITNSDYTAHAVYKAARELGLRIGPEVSVVGHDDLATSELLDPPLATIWLNRREMGRALMLRLLGRVPPGDYVAPVKLIERASLRATEPRLVQLPSASAS